MTFDLARAVKEGCRTRDGRPVRILCDNVKVGDGSFMTGAAVECGDGSESIQIYNQFGKHCEGVDDFDLVNLPDAHEVTMQLWQHSDGGWAVLCNVDGETAHNPGPSQLRTSPAWTGWGKPVTVRIEKDT